MFPAHHAASANWQGAILTCKEQSSKARHSHHTSGSGQEPNTATCLPAAVEKKEVLLSSFPNVFVSYPSPRACIFGLAMLLLHDAVARKRNFYSPMIPTSLSPARSVSPFCALSESVLPQQQLPGLARAAAAAWPADHCSASPSAASHRWQSSCKLHAQAACVDSGQLGRAAQPLLKVILWASCAYCIAVAAARTSITYAAADVVTASCTRARLSARWLPLARTLAACLSQILR